MTRRTSLPSLIVYPTRERPPSGKLGKLTVGRLIKGGNLIGGDGHSRDLLYVSRLLREYNTDSRILDLKLAEESGVNMIRVAPGSVDIVARYRKERGGKLQMMVCVDVDQSEPGGRWEFRDWSTRGPKRCTRMANERIAR